MKKNYLSLITLIVSGLIVSCSNGPSKKVIIIGKGEIVVNENSITMKDKSGYAEQIMELSGNKEIVLNIETPKEKSTVTIPVDAGVFILNLRADTLAGSKQNFGKDLNNREVISQEKIKLIIDSLQNLTVGKNVNAEGNNFMILPNQFTKISSNINAKVFGPFTKIPSTLEADKDGNAPELYKFYTNTEVRDLIQHLIQQTK